MSKILRIFNANENDDRDPKAAEEHGYDEYELRDQPSGVAQHGPDVLFGHVLSFGDRRPDAIGSRSHSASVVVRR